MRGLLIVSFVAGVHFAIVQTSYFLLLESFVSSQALSYFVALFFWLIGLAAGLWLRRERLFLPLLIGGTLSYYATLVVTGRLPFASGLYLVAGACSVVSGLLPGYFFRFIGPRAQPIARALLHENNGFIVGLAIGLLGATRFGGALVSVLPGLTCVALAASYVLATRARRGAPA